MDQGSWRASGFIRYRTSHGNLVNSLRRICYEDRAQVYDATVHLLEVHGRLAPLQNLLADMSPGFPCRISKKVALRAVENESLQWLVDRTVDPSRLQYGDDP